MHHGVIHMMNSLTSILRVILLGGLIAFSLSTTAPVRAQWAGHLDIFNPGLVGSHVYATAMQPDGKMIIGGDFTMAGGAAHVNIARLNEDGSVDASFTASANNIVYCVVVQGDGKIVLGGTFTTVNGVTRNRIARLHPDGSLEGTATFNPGTGASHAVVGIALQTDGKLVIGGDFLQINAMARPRIARLHADGSLESTNTFNSGTGASNSVGCVLVQPDGRIVLAGSFTTFNRVTRNRIARLHADGSLESTATFNPGTGANDTILGVASQPDGKIVLGGLFNTVNGFTRTRIARLHADGSVESTATFNPGSGANNSVYCVAVQADGRILLGGFFDQVSGMIRSRIARLNADGSVESTSTFNPGGPSGFVNGVALQNSGKIILGGNFGGISANVRNRIARLLNDPAPQAVSAPDATQVRWSRSGSAPEVAQVSFDLKPDGGTVWTPLGVGSRIGTTADWQCTGVSLPAGGQLRARGRTNGGYLGGSSGLVETVSAFSFDTTTLAPTLIAPVANGVTGSPVNVSFSLPEAALPGSVTLSFGGTVLALATSEESAGTHSFVFYPANPAASAEVVSGGTIVNGFYTVTLSYRDALGNPAAAATAANVQVAVPSDPVVTVLGRKGGAVAGAGVEGSGIPAGAVWVRFGVPSVNEAGKAVVLATYKVGTASTTAILGWELADMAGTMRVLVRRGDVLPGAAGAVFGAFKEPLINEGGRVFWMAKLANGPGTTGVTTANDTAIVSITNTVPPTFVVEAREGAVADGSFGLNGQQPVWGALTSVAVGHSTVAFTGKLAIGPGGVTAATDSGLWVRWLDPPTGFEPGPGFATQTLGEGFYAVVNSPLKRFSALAARPGSPGQGNAVVWDGSADHSIFRLTHEDGRQSLGSDRFVGKVIRYVSGEDATDYGAGAKWLRFGLPTQNAATAMAFLGTVKAGTGTATALNNVAIFAEDDVGYLAARVVGKGDATGVSGGVFSVLKDPVNAGNRGVAFMGTMKVVPGITAAENDGIWRSDDTNGLSLVAREGALAAEAGGGVWKTFTSLALPEGRGPLFVASMATKTGTVSPGPGNVTTGNDVGLWATDSFGGLRLLLREGDAVGASTVKTFVVLSTVAGSSAQTRSFNSSGSVLVKATDALGAQHLLHIAVP